MEKWWLSGAGGRQTQGNTHAAAAKSPQSCPTLCNPTDGSPPGSSVHRILQARTLEWVAIAFSMIHMRRYKSLVMRTSSKNLKCNVVVIVNDMVSQTWKLLRADLASLPLYQHIHTELSMLTTWGDDVPVILILVIILQHVCISNHHTVYFKYAQLDLSIIPKFKKERNSAKINYLRNGSKSFIQTYYSTFHTKWIFTAGYYY